MTNNVSSQVSVINDVEISVDEFGVTHFKPIERPNQLTTIYVEDRPWWKRLYDWWTDADVRPYVKIRDVANPFGDRDDPDAGSDGKTGVEAGIQIRF